MEFTHFLRRLVLPPGGFFSMLAFAGLLRRRWPGPARKLALLTLALLWALSTPWLSFGLMSLLESDATLTPAQLSGLQADTIVVLGGGLRSDSPEYGRPQPSLSSLERLRYGIWLQRRLNLPLLLSSGNTDPSRSQLSEAAAMAEVARDEFQLGQIELEEKSRTTWENARECAGLLLPRNRRRVLLVTDLHHMRRARSCFEAQGFTVLAAPVGTAAPGRFERGLFAWLPSYAALNRSSMALEEALGNLVYSLRRLL